nr:hypothetical protein [Tanacetum cinerariifolium]
MHMYKSSLDESHHKYLVKLYGISEDFHPRVVPEGMTMNVLPLGAIGLYAHHFQQGGLWVHFSSFFLKRPAPIAMAWRHHDSSVANSSPRPSISNVWKHTDRAFSIKDLERKVITTAEFLRLPNFKGWLEDIPPNTGDMMVAEIPCRKVLDDKEKKKRKSEEKAAAKVHAVNTQAETVVNKDAGKAGPHKKRRVRVEAQVHLDLEHVSSPIPLNHAKPLEALDNEEHVYPSLLLDRMDTLRDQTDEHVTPSRVVYASKLVIDEEGQGNVDASHAIEGYGDNEGYSAGRFGNLPFNPQWGLTDSSNMDNSHVCRDMMANLFTSADEEFFNKGVRDESAIKRSWRLLCQYAKQQANTLLHFEALKEQHADLAYSHESCKFVKARYKECKKELATVQSAYDEKVFAFNQLFKNYDGALIQEKGLHDMLEELEEKKKEEDQLNSSPADRIK